MPFISGGSGTFFSGRRKGAITNPNLLPNLQIWYDGSDISVFNPTNPSSGAGITQWGDKSAFAHNANPTGGGTGVRPLYITNVQNSKSVVRFDGVEKNLTVNPASWAANLSGLTVYMVAKASTLSGTRSLFATSNGVKIYHNGSNWAVKDDTGTGTSTVSGDTTGFHIFGFIFDGTKAVNADRVTFRYDRDQRDLTVSGSYSSTTSALTNRIDFGFFNNTEFFSGDIAEIIILSRATTGSNIASIEDYLSRKWSL